MPDHEGIIIQTTCSICGEIFTREISLSAFNPETLALKIPCYTCREQKEKREN